MWWAIRCLPLRNRVLRAYCSKATGVVEDEFNVETSHGKIKLDLAGEGFLPSLTAAHTISDIIRGHYSQPWPSWKKIPDATRKFWWEKFKSKHQFFPPDLYWARKNFERRGVALLKSLLGKARTSRVKPQWIEDDVWDVLCVYWNADTGFLQKSAQGKSNRASLHTAGPITITQHKTNMKKSLKRTPTQLDLFAKTHKHKDETRVDKKSKHIHNAIEEAIQKASEKGSNAPNEMDVWYEIATFKKGRIHGLVIKFTAIGSSAQSSDWLRKLEHEEVMKRMQEWLRMLEHEEIMKKMQEENADLKTRLEKIERRVELLNYKLLKTIKKLDVKIPISQLEGGQI
ncbi:uncharacterized protein [Arachis hypogaea]|uniref:uncharacterized protein n=2 Tax=Arachis TaxID=3817 RepID=UPI000DEC2FA6|nr:uncharacterized protein LOC112728538 [Arachis hypogaea]XP_025634501.1 uncharacterized protein LOC112728538 [Arachis hypogaea]XP_025634502.1 uncharacterized protein LOC112728538 [Arachis hypogaea]XP_025634503.1 uncharacterized protein LOC112728538 [Arachis hypogaea]XP_025634504.1 uncharacterized protein LOC112728538 [Arachis hypogaea]XP_025634505.1 uncharacterized protein LOC112728538 [Arachis hypogaea]